MAVQWHRNAMACVETYLGRETRRERPARASVASARHARARAPLAALIRPPLRPNLRLVFPSPPTCSAQIRHLACHVTMHVDACLDCIQERDNVMHKIQI